VTEANGSIASVARIGYKQNNGLPIRRSAAEYPAEAARPVSVLLPDFN
jgi:hypothetical protein